MMKRLIILTGPTASGKSGLSLRLAKELGCEIVSADSMQVYKHMDIGTAKISAGEMQGIPHHLIDVLEPTEEYNVTRFKDEAELALKDIYDRGRLPLIVGGTGFYIQALLYDIDFSDTAQTPYRESLFKEAREKGSLCLYEKLKECDPDAAVYIHANDVKRITRALEYYHETGKKISEHNREERRRTSPYDFRYFVLNKPREILYKDIDDRVDEMIKRGLVDEVKRLKDLGCKADMVSMYGLGYKEILKYLDGAISLDEAVYIIKRDTRHFAKRQITWFKRERDVIWINKDEFNYDDDKIIDFMLEKINNGRVTEEV
ncbi:MAG: tRNA (adenosine(37)-N6)-dimethylallyltransferase MiaA [Lachnospiraceae bacterium]|nr:tRNA (adenosine(37)-N6)-dimethylallyltransferase MiaA [Lachnospiraceae bacterium]